MGQKPLDKMDGFEKREVLGSAYWNDPRWKQVTALREQGENLASNALVYEIRRHWGVD